MSRQMKDSGLPWIREIPETWDVLPNKYVMKKKKTICPLYKGEPILSLTMNGVIVRDLENLTGKRPTTFDGYQRIQKRNLLMCLFDIDVTPRCVGLIKENGLTSPAYSQFCMTEKACANYYYYYYLLLDFTKELLHLAKNLRHSLTEDQLGAIKVPVPSIKEQQRIADYLDKKCAEIDTLSNSIQQQIDTLEQYKRAVITETVTKGLNPSAPMKDSGIAWIGQIPASWSTLPLRYWMLSRQSGAWGENEQQNQDDHPCVRVADFDYDTYQLKDNTPTTLRNYTQQTVNLLALKKNDILIEKSGGGEKTPVGRSIIIRKDFDSPTLFANFVERIRIKPMYCAIYVEYALVAFYKQGLSTFYFQQTTGIQNLNITKMFRMENIPCPSLHEQQAIAEYLDKKCAKIDGIIQAKQQQLEELEQYRKAIIFEYVTGKKQVPEV